MLPLGLAAVGDVVSVRLKFQISFVSSAIGLTTSQYWVSETRDTGISGVTVWRMVLLPAGRPVKLQLSIVPSGSPPLEESRLSMAELVPEKWESATPICVSVKSSSGVKATAGI